MSEKRIQLKINAMAPNKIVKARINIKKKEKLIKKQKRLWRILKIITAKIKYTI